MEERKRRKSEQLIFDITLKEKYISQRERMRKKKKITEISQTFP